MKLSDAPFKVNLRVSRINLDNDKKERLKSIGLDENAIVVKLYNSFFSTSSAIKIGYIKIALRRELLEQIEVNNV